MSDEPILMPLRGGVVTSNPHANPLVMATSRHGAWVECRCGWLSTPCRNARAASVAWAEHVRGAT